MTRGRRGRGSVDARPNSDGTVSYRVRWTDGEGRQTRTFHDEHEARAFLLGVEREMSRGTYTPPSKLTVAEMVARHIERVATRRSPATVATYRQRAEAHILPYLGHVELEKLTTPQVQAWVDRLGKRLAPATVQPTLAVLTGALGEAVRLGYIDRNVAQGVRRPTVRAPKMQTWSPAQVRAVLAATDQPMWRALYHVALLGGLRPGELRALRWEDVDLGHARVRVRRTVSKRAEGGYTVREETKRGGGRVVALATPAVEALRAWRDVRTGQGYVFGKAGPLNAMTWTRYHERLCGRAGVPRITFHAMRHTAASLLLERGIHPKVVADMLGHSSVEITLDRYSHVSTDLQASAAQALAALVADATTSDASEDQKKR